MIRSTGVSAVVALAAFLPGLLAGCNSAGGSPRGDVMVQAVPQAGELDADSGRPGVWKIEYVLSGGFAGMHRQLSLNSSGVLIAADVRTKKSVEKQAAPEALADIAALLAKMDRSGMPDGRRPFANTCADCLQYGLTVVIDGQEYRQRFHELSLTDPVHAALVGLLSSLLQQALSYK